MGWQWHQLDHMQIICTSLQTDNHASTSIQHRTVLIIFPLILQTIITAQMLSTEESVWHVLATMNAAQMIAELKPREAACNSLHLECVETTKCLADNC